MTWETEFDLYSFPNLHRGEARTEVNKLLAAVLDNESSLLRRLVVFSVLVERATALRDETLDDYIRDEALIIQPYKRRSIATLAGLSAQTIRSRERKLRQKGWGDD